MRTRNKDGFTIIEILIVLIITSLLLGLGTVRYRDFAKRQAVSIAKRQLVGDIRSAQSDALNGRKPPGCTGTLVGIHFYIYGTAGPPRYRIYANCQLPNGNYVIKEATLDPDVTLSINPSSGSNIQFKPIAHGTNISGNVTITIRHAQTTLVDTLVISSSGEIR